VGVSVNAAGTGGSTAGGGAADVAVGVALGNGVAVAGIISTEAGVDEGVAVWAAALTKPFSCRSPGAVWFATSATTNMIINTATSPMTNRLLDRLNDAGDGALAAALLLAVRSR
jgi:hypothetical protein